MTKSEDNAGDIQDVEDAQSPEQTGTLFPRRQVESVVRGFLLAWIRGDVRIGSLVTTEHVVDLNKVARICTGVEKGTPQECQQAVDKIFTYILTLRSVGVLDGKFYEYDIEKKIKALERKLEATNNVIRQFVQWFRGSATQ